MIAGCRVLEFRVGSQRYGLDLAFVREVVRAVAVSALPGAPQLVLGVINFRGTVVPVLDVARRFGQPATDVHQGQHFIFATARNRLVALQVDEALGLLEVPADAVVAETIYPGVERVVALASQADGVLAIADLDRFLTETEAGQLAEVMA